jgi:hypothetical protein
MTEIKAFLKPDKGYGPFYSVVVGEMSSTVNVDKVKNKDAKTLEDFVDHETYLKMKWQIYNHETKERKAVDPPNYPKYLPAGQTVMVIGSNTPIQIQTPAGNERPNWDQINAQKQQQIQEAQRERKAENDALIVAMADLKKGINQNTNAIDDLIKLIGKLVLPLNPQQAADQVIEKKGAKS